MAPDLEKEFELITNQSDFGKKIYIQIQDRRCTALPLIAQ